MGKNGIERLEAHQPDYKSLSYKEYSIAELGNIIGFFVKRAGHRSNPDKQRKDLYDAKNYLAMLTEKAKNKAEKLGIDFDSL